MWQECATKSFGNKRTRSLSRSKSLGRTRKPSYQPPPTGTFDFLAERTLLGHQAIPPVVHTTNSSAIPTQTIPGGGQATRSFGSAFPRLRSTSHGHSNSAGVILDGPGHRRKESVSSVLRRARSTATGLCVGADGTSTPPNALDASTGKDDIKIATRSERSRGMASPDSAGLISPITDQNRTSPDRSLLVPSRQGLGVSPTPSDLSRSVEGVGIAISSPLPSEGHSDDETITLPAHPYAQGANNHRQTPTNSTPQRPELMHHRQPIVHPYAIHSVHPATLPPRWVHRDQTISPARKMFAEITPGHLREIRPEEIQYSPYIDDTPGAPAAHVINRPGVAGRQYADPPSRRDSDTLRMGDALNSSLVHDRLSSSTDSGVGVSEDPHPYGPQPERAAPSRSNTSPLRPVRELLSSANDRDEGASRSQRPEPSSILPPANSNNSDPTSLRTASSGQLNSSVFPDPLTPVRRIESSGSSPGLSNDSSPPLTPRPLGRLDDWERFHDLFYNPTTNPPPLPELPSVTVSTAEHEDRRPAPSSVHLARSKSQLTTLVRQLSEGLHELRNEEPTSGDGGRLESLNDEQLKDPVTSPGTSPSDGSPSVLGTTHPFLSTLSPQHPLDQPVASSRQNFPEDVESELSSLSDGIPEEDYDEITGSHFHPFEDTEANMSTKKPYVSATLKQFPPRLPSIVHAACRVRLFHWNATLSFADVYI